MGSNSKLKNLLLVALLIGAGYFFWQASRTTEPSQPVVKAKPVPDVEAVPEVPAPSAKTEPKKVVREETPAEQPVSEEEVLKIRSDIRVSLSGVYSAMKAFYFEHGSYSTDLISIGWQPPDGNLRMRIGFLEPGPAAKVADEDPRRSDSDIYTEELTDDGKPRYTYLPPAQGISLQDARSFCENRCSSWEKGFEIIAVSNLDDDADLDIWSINDRKELVQLSDDITPISRQ